MQDMTRWISVIGALLLAASAYADGQDGLSDIRPRPLGWAIEAVRTGDFEAAARIAERDGAVATDIVEWMRLRAGRGTPQEVMEFLARRTDWPGLARLRAQSERAMAAAPDPRLLTFFDEVPPVTAEGAWAYARALGRSAGREAEAQLVLRKAWTSVALTKEEQAQFLAALDGDDAGNAFARLDAMLWKDWHDNARRVLPLVGKAEAQVAEARIALQLRQGNVDKLIEALPAKADGYAGLYHARFEWRVRKGRWESAKELLLERSASAATLGQPAAWANRRRALARDELREGKAERAYQMASQHHLSSGAHYADLEWLSGFIALRHLNRAEDALRHFRNHDSAVVSPISQGRAGYWQGRALQAMGDFAAADQAFTAGAAYQTSFYGLLAAEAAGLPFDVGLQDVPQEDWRTSPLVQDSLFMAGQLLLASGERSLAEVFWVHFAEQLGEGDAALLGQAAIDLQEPHLAVMIGKAVARRGATVPAPYYPLHPLAEAKLPVAPELALAVARRESEFDPVVVSGVGARGLMQLMPRTAKAVAAELGLSAEHSTARLTADPVYNAVLGTQYLAELSARFGRNLVMVSAGYNAGPSRPIRWMAEYGDPRGQDIDVMIDWIEGIPFRETRNYVMRVTESLPVFRARLGQDPLPVPFSEMLLGPGLQN